MSGMRKVRCIVAMDSRRGIFKNDKIPWHLHNDMKHFASVTKNVLSKEKQNAVVMSKSSYFLIPEQIRPLSNRLNVVLSNTNETDLPNEVLLETDLTSAIRKLSDEPFKSNVENVYIAGGVEVFKETLQKGLCDHIYITKVHGDFQCDTFFPEFDENMFKEVHNPPGTPQGVQTEEGINYTFHVFAIQDALQLK